MQTLLEALQFEFFQRSLIVGLLLAVAYALLGNFVILRKEAVIGHTIANFAFLGVALGLLLNFPPQIAAILAALLIAIILHLVKSGRTAADSRLVIWAQLAMAAAIVVISLLPGYRPDLLQYLFGSILAISTFDLWVAVGSVVAVLVFYFGWRRQLLQMIVSPVIARSFGNTGRGLQLGYYFLLCLVIALGVKVVGVILLEALLILPGNIAKLRARSFAGLTKMSVGVAVTSVVIGMFASYLFDIPSGAAIVLVLGGLYLGVLTFSSRT